MSALTILFRISFAALALNAVYGKVNRVPLPTIDPNEWWGPGSAPSNPDTSIKSFTIQFDPAMISDLKARLSNHRQFRAPLEGVGFTYGTNSTTLEYFINYLGNQYKFDERLTYLNQFSHYITMIQGLNIHYIRVKEITDDVKTNVVPLLILHGWPGSIREFYETMPYLQSTAKAQGMSMDIIVPSLPGFGYSDGAVRPGMGCDKVAIILKNLMQRIGYKQFYLQAGDMGAMVGSSMVTFFPTEVLGYHTTLPFVWTPNIIATLIMGNLHKDEIAEPQFLPRLYPSLDILFAFMTNSGYLHEQATRPDTVGCGLSDSPSALMSYMLEKFTYTVRKEFLKAPDGGLFSIFTPEQLLDNIMIYWSTNSMTTAMRLYAETFNKRFIGLRLNEIKVPTPTWVLLGPSELYLPAWIIKKKFPNLLNMTIPVEGGHFFAWEKPQVYAQDVVNAIVAFQKWHAMNTTMFTQCSSYIDY